MCSISAKKSLMFPITCNSRGFRHGPMSRKSPAADECPVTFPAQVISQDRIHVEMIEMKSDIGRPLIPQVDGSIDVELAVFEFGNARQPEFRPRVTASNLYSPMRS